MIAITSKEVELFAEFIHARTGIVLTHAKAYLLENRLSPMLEQYGAKSFTDFFYAGYRSAEWAAKVIEAITTNETSFFRDQRPFELLQTEILPELLAKRQGEGESSSGVRIWSAACSTGQEVYSVGMIAAEVLGGELTRRQVAITGTDISDSVLHKAREGIYTRYEVERGVPPPLRAKYFEAKGDLLRVRSDLRAIAEFKKINLLALPAENELFDLVLCRNVAIYFNQEDRRRLFEHIAARLRPGGILIIGATESLFGVTDSFSRNESCNTVYFRGIGR